MYTDENSDKESDDDKSVLDSANVTKKSLSTVGFRKNGDAGNARPLALRATQSLTGEEARLCGSLQRVSLRAPAQPPPKVCACPCGCRLRAPAPAPFRTRDQNTLALHVVPPDVLRHHGYSFTATDIAMFWKKDCRTFLWKGHAKKKMLHTECNRLCNK